MAVSAPKPDPPKIVSIDIIFKGIFIDFIKWEFLGQGPRPLHRGSRKTRRGKIRRGKIRRVENSPPGKFAAGKIRRGKIRRWENSPRENLPLGKFAAGKFAA